MVLFNYSTKELTAKIVYYGPGLCGKTTNLQYIFSNLPPNVHKGKMLSLATQTDRTLFFDFLPIDLGTIRGMKTRLQLYTVPGQVFYNTTRKLVLKGADGLVFVADSQRKMLDADVESFSNLEENLREHGMELSQIPHVIQFNKRDLANVLSAEELNAGLNKYNAPIYEAVATTGIGVHDTLKAVTRLVLNSLKEKYDGKKAASKPAAQQAAAAAVAAAPAAPAGVARRAPARPAEEPVMAVEPEEAVLEIEAEPVLEVEAEAIELVEEEPSPLAVEEIEVEKIQELPDFEDQPVEVLDVEEGSVEEISVEEFQVETGIPEPMELVVEDSVEAPELGSLVEEMEPTAGPSPAGGVSTSGAFPAGTVIDGSTVAVSVGTKNLPAATISGPVKATAPGEISFPLSVKIQGRTVTVSVTLSIRVEQT